MDSKRDGYGSTIRLAAVLVTAPFLLQAAAASQVPDRSALSYDENVIVNTACFAAAQQSSSAYDGCVRAQLAALQAHPRPTVPPSAALNQKIERGCAYQRQVGIAEYNECVGKAMTTPAATAEAAEYQFGPDFTKVFATGPDRPKPSESVAPHILAAAQHGASPNAPAASITPFCHQRGHLQEGRTLGVHRLQRRGHWPMQSRATSCSVRPWPWPSTSC